MLLDPWWGGALTPLPPTFALEESSRALSLDPRDPAFVPDPNPAYRALLELEPPKHARRHSLVNHPFLLRVTERLHPRLESLAAPARFRDMHHFRGLEGLRLRW